MDEVPTPHALVTGATGFIGRNLCRALLTAGWRVTVLTRETPERATLFEARDVETASFSDYSQVQEIARVVRPDVVFHLAARQARSHIAAGLDGMVDANITLGAHLLEGLSGSDCVFVSAMSYFQFRHNLPTPFSLYSATKQGFMEISAFYREKAGLDTREVILYDNYGPADPRDKLVPLLIRALQEDSSIALGPLSQTMNALHVADVATGLMMASRPGNPSVMTVRAADRTTVGDVVRFLEGIAGRKLRVSIDRSRPVHDLVENSGDWPLPTDWTPAWALLDGLEATYRSRLA